MTLATRDEHGFEYCPIFDSNETSVIARYIINVAGANRILIVESWLTPEGIQEPAVIEWTLKNMDKEAEWAAAHPDDVPTAQWTFT